MNKKDTSRYSLHRQREAMNRYIVLGRELTATSRDKMVIFFVPILAKIISRAVIDVTLVNFCALLSDLAAMTKTEVSV